MNSLRKTENSRPDVEKISFILPSLNAGGAERVCLNLAKGFVKKGINVEFLLVIPSVQLDIPKGVQVRFLSKKNQKIQWVAGIVALIKIGRQLSESKQTHVFFSTVRGTVILSLLASVFVKSRPRIIVREAALFSKKMWYPKLFHKLALRILYPRAYAVVAVSERVKNEMVNQYGYRGKIFVVNNPIDKEKIIEQSLAIEISSRFDFTFLSVGRLVPEKGHLYLLEAFSKIAHDRSCGLYIIGSGRLENTLKIRAKELGISDQVVWLGYQPNPYPWYRCADVFVLSSISEGFVNVLGEALAIGVPNIVATRCGGGPEELLANHTSAWLVSPENIDELAIAMEQARVNSGHKGIQARSGVPDISSITEEYMHIFMHSAR